MKKIFTNIICCFIPFKKLRHRLRNKEASFLKINGKNNKIMILKDGVELPFANAAGLGVDISGNNNIIKFDIGGKNVKLASVKIVINGDSNNILISEGFSAAMNIHIVNGNANNIVIGSKFSSVGAVSFSLYGNDNSLKIGKNFQSSSFSISLINNICEIGDSCLFGNNITIWGDGHSVIDAKTKKLLNFPTSPILVGDRVWIGERVTLTKGAQVPSDCIVGIASVVTKKFDEENCVIAGAPARVAKTGVAWDYLTPANYREQVEKNL